MSALPVSAIDFDAGAARDPAHDFDFLHGDWRIVSRKRIGILCNDDRWETFTAATHVRPLPFGIGNRDDFTAPSWRPNWAGATVRIYDPRSKRWSLYWATSSGAGMDIETGLLAPPVVGRFDGDTGLFDGDDVWEDRPIRVRYTWRRVDSGRAHWEQAFSTDGGESWEVNWAMDLTRVDTHAELCTLEETLAQAWLRADTATLVHELADAYVWSDARGERRNKAQEIARLDDRQVQFTRYEKRDLAVHLLDLDTALVHGIARVAGREGDAAFDHEVRFASVFTQCRGRWQLAGGQASMSGSR